MDGTRFDDFTRSLPRRRGRGDRTGRRLGRGGDLPAGWRRLRQGR